MPKLTVIELQELARQLSCPEGDSGKKVGEMMNATNGNMIFETINSLELKEKDCVLEIGPGNASHVKNILEKASGIQYHGVDISDIMIKEAMANNHKFKNASFLLYDGEILPFKNNSFDKILTVNTVYFWKDHLAFTKEIFRVLKNGGILSLAFIPKSTMQNIPFSKFGFQLFDEDTLSNILTNSGLKIKNIISKKEKVISNSGESIEREFAIIVVKK